MSTVSIFRQMIGQVMVVSKYLWNVGKFMRLHGATSQKTVIFILAAVRTWNLKVSEKLSLIPSAITLVQIFMHLNLHKYGTVTLFLPLHQQIKEWRMHGFWAGLFPVMGWGRLYFHLLCRLLAYISYETPLEISLTLLTDYVLPSYSPQMKRGRSMIQLVTYKYKTRIHLKAHSFLLCINHISTCKTWSYAKFKSTHQRRVYTS
jgi:hypothetical protein